MNDTQKVILKKRAKTRDLLTLINVIGLFTISMVYFALSNYLNLSIITYFLFLPLLLESSNFILLKSLPVKPKKTAFTSPLIIASSKNTTLFTEDEISEKMKHYLSTLVYASGVNPQNLQLVLHPIASDNSWKLKPGEACSVSAGYYNSISFSESYLFGSDEITLGVLGHELGHIYQKDYINTQVSRSMKRVAVIFFVAIYIILLMSLPFIHTTILVGLFGLASMWFFNLPLRYLENTADLFTKMIGFGEGCARELDRTKQKPITDLLIGIFLDHPSTRSRLKRLV